MLITHRCIRSNAMNILRLVVSEKEKKDRPTNPEFQKLEEEASIKDKPQCPLTVDKEELRKKLSPVEYHVTQERGTERCEIVSQSHY